MTSKRSIPSGDKVRIALAPLHLLLGLALLLQFARGARAPMVAVLGLLFAAFGVYKIRLVWRAVARHRLSAEGPTGAAPGRRRGKTTAP